MRRLSLVAVALGLLAMLVAPHGPSVEAQPIASIALPPPRSTVQLYSGCNNIALSFPNGTSSQTVVDAVTPAGTVQAMWRHDAAQSRFEGFSPAAPQASDLQTVNFLDAVWICVSPSAVGPGPTPQPTGSPSPTGFSVHFIDVGQGDAILVESGDEDILVDGGRSGTAVLSYLTAQGVPDIDLMVATHPDADHIGGLDDVLAQYDVGEIWTNGASATSQTYQGFAAAVAAEGAVERQIRRGYSTQFGGVTLTALHPTDPLTGDSNTNSIVLRLSCGSVNVLLTGDANASSEASMLADPSVDLDADVLKVGHHGSSTSTTNAFLDAVSPKDAVISVGAGNSYGHPAQDTLNRLAAHGVKVYRTDLNGTVVLTSDCNTYSISTTGAAPAPQPTTSTGGPPPPPPTAPATVDCSRDQYNCGDFSTCAEVMAVFNACPGDPNRLDGDHDGVPCESLCQ
jgi:beta-lactamase superfamily II metal-dependent hydrolase